MSTFDKKSLIAKRVALLFKDGELVNLGVGIPTLVPSFLTGGISVWIESENGIIGAGPPAEEGNTDVFLKNAGDRFCTILPGGCCFSSAMSFGLIRGGHLAATVLGAMQVDQEGNLANWIIPGGKLTGMGGAMDLVTGAKKVIIATEHCTKSGEPKILRRCTFPLTGKKVVDLIVTELALIEVAQSGLILREIAPNITIDEVMAKTEAKLIVPDGIKTMEI